MEVFEVKIGEALDKINAVKSENVVFKQKITELEQSVQFNQDQMEDQIKKMDQLENLVISQSKQIASLLNAVVGKEVQIEKLEDEIFQKLLDMEIHSREYNVVGINETKKGNCKKLVAEEIQNKKLFPKDNPTLEEIMQKI